jgi:hypothetical protein
LDIEQSCLIWGIYFTVLIDMGARSNRLTKTNIMLVGANLFWPESEGEFLSLMTNRM